LRDFIAVLLIGYLKNRSLMEELIKIDLSEDLSSVKVPYKIIQGSTDIVTSSKSIQKYVSECGNNISLVTIPQNGHVPNGKGMEQVLNEIVAMS